MRYNLTKTVRKRPIDEAGNVLGEWYIDPRDIKHEARARPGPARRRGLAWLGVRIGCLRGAAREHAGQRQGGADALVALSRHKGGGLAAAGAASGC